MLDVKLSNELVNPDIVFVFCIIAIGELGNLTLSFLTSPTDFGVIPTGLSPVAKAAKSSVSVIGKVANCVTILFKSFARF